MVLPTQFPYHKNIKNKDEQKCYNWCTACYLALWTLLRVDLSVVLLACPRLEQLVTAPEVGAPHVGVPGGVAQETPVKLALRARHHHAKFVTGREQFPVDRQHVTAARACAAQRVTVGIDQKLRVACLVCTAKPRKDLVAVHQRTAVGTDALDLRAQTHIRGAFKKVID